MRGKIGCRAAVRGLATLAAVVLARQAAGAGSTPRSPVATGDWPMYGHDVARTNYNPDETTISAGNVGQLVQRWQANIGTNGTPSSSGPIVSNGRVFVGSSASSGDNYFAFDALTGAPAWSVPLSYTAACEQVGIGATAAISGTTLVVGAATRPIMASTPRRARNSGGMR